jgi:hypothetical protein
MIKEGDWIGNEYYCGDPNKKAPTVSDEGI